MSDNYAVTIHIKQLRSLGQFDGRPEITDATELGDGLVDFKVRMYDRGAPQLGRDVHVILNREGDMIANASSERDQEGWFITARMFREAQHSVLSAPEFEERRFERGQWSDFLGRKGAVTTIREYAIAKNNESKEVSA